MFGGKFSNFCNLFRFMVLKEAFESYTENNMFSPKKSKRKGEIHTEIMSHEAHIVNHNL